MYYAIKLLWLSVYDDDDHHCMFNTYIPIPYIYYIPNLHQHTEEKI